MKFDIVITTYNRPESTERFVRQILTCTILPETIFVVDSSEHPTPSIGLLDKVKHVHSSHKNQPYQRYLGASFSTASVICFFDDDLQITDPKVFEYLLEPYQDAAVVGSSVGIDYHNSIAGESPRSLMEPSGMAGKLILKLSGVKFPRAGKISYAGMTGPKPLSVQDVDFFYGPCMSFRRASFMSTLNSRLLDIFEQKQGMGEDKVISMLMSKHGLLRYNPVICLLHPAVESSYYNNMAGFTAKTVYSRKLLNDIFAEVWQLNKLIANIQLAWYILGRLLISCVTYLIKPESSRKQRLAGMWTGTKMIWSRQHNSSYNWTTELQKDVSR